MQFPKDLKYTKEHEWVRLSADGKTGTVGITEFATQELGDIVFVEVDSIGSHVAKDEVFGSVEAVKTVSELFMPVSGTVLELNPALDANPELVNSDPYGDGWMIRVSIADASEANDLLSPDDYASMISA
jgi:glycine cleavage system H protein